jgi:antitoxin VapB
VALVTPLNAAIVAADTRVARSERSSTSCDLPVLTHRIYFDAMPPTRAKVFWSGNSQAVRIPKDFRIDGDEVLIEKDDDRLIVKPLRRRWSRQFLESFGAAADLKRPRQPRPQRRARVFA